MPKININGITRISIHAPREGCDISVQVPFMCTVYFNPRTP